MVDIYSAHSAYATNYNKPANIPIHAHWDVTYGCNFRCTFCLTSSGPCCPNELTTEQGIILINKLYDAGIVFLKILGGEPFFRKDILNILNHAAKKGMILSFSTNASMVTNEVAEALSQLKNSIVYLQMSLYGENEETYERVTGSGQNFWRALNGLKLLRDKGLDVTILVVATEENSHKIKEYLDIAKRFGVSELRITPVIAVGRAANADEIISEPRIWATLIKQLKEISQSLKETDPLVRIDARPLFGAFISNLTGLPCCWENCTSATKMIYIDPTGKAAPCPFLKAMSARLKEKYSHMKMEDIIDNTFEYVWNSPSFQQIREYYNPEKNLFKINTKCRFYKDGSCIPCVLTPCNCSGKIQEVKRELKQNDSG